MTNIFQQNANVSVIIKGFSNHHKEDKITVSSFKLEEYFCKLYDMEIVLENVSFDGELLDFSHATEKNILNNFIKVEIELARTVEEPNEVDFKRTITGVIVDYKFSFHELRSKKSHPLNILTLFIKPNIHLMDIEKKKRIFKGQSKNDICKQIFDENKIKFNKNKILLPEFKPKMTKPSTFSTVNVYITQYEETDFTFFCRLLEEHKLIYFIHYDKDGKELLSIGDSSELFINQKPNIFGFSNVFSTIDSFTKIKYPEIQMGIKAEDVLSHLQQDKTSDASQTIPFFKSSLRKLLTVGSKITLKNLFKNLGKPSDDMNVIYTKTIYKGDFLKNGVLAHEIIFYPKDLDLLLMKKINKPKVFSTQYATVVAKDKEKVSLEDNAMIYIYLYWNGEVKPDKPEKELLTPPIYVSVGQMFGGVSGDSGKCGAWFIPRVGQKVIVHFIDGDTDKPIIAGVVYEETKNIAPYKKSEGATKFSIQTNSKPSAKDGPAGHELTFEDKEEHEKILMSSSRDYELKIQHDYKTNIEKGDATYEIKEGNEKITLTKGNYTLTLTDGKIFIETKNGDIEFKSKKNITFHCEGKFSVDAEKGIDIVSGKTINITSDSSTTVEAKKSLKIQANSASIKADMDAKIEATNITIKSGATMAVEASGPLQMKGAMVQIN